jgi:hypothetical protein
MRVNIAKYAAAAMAALLLAGCAREGFEASLSRSAAPSSSDASSAARQSQAFEIGTGEVDSGGIYMGYALPRGGSEMERAASAIAEQIHKVLFEVSDSFDLTGEGAELTIFDGVTQNDGTFYSILYDGQYTPSQEGSTRRFQFAMTFDSVTGRALSIDDFFDPQALSVLLLDEQISTVLNRDEELAAAQRRHLTDLGSQTLAARLAGGSGADPIAALLDASFYLEGGRLAAVFSAPQDLGGSVRVSVAL